MLGQVSGSFRCGLLISLRLSETLPSALSCAPAGRGEFRTAPAAKKREKDFRNGIGQPRLGFWGPMGRSIILHSPLAAQPLWLRESPIRGLEGFGLLPSAR